MSLTFLSTASLDAVQRLHQHLTVARDELCDHIHTFGAERSTPNLKKQCNGFASTKGVAVRLKAAAETAHVELQMDTGHKGLSMQQFTTVCLAFCGHCVASSIKRSPEIPHAKAGAVGGQAAVSSMPPGCICQA